MVPRSSLVRKPANLSHEQAASVGVTFVTAWCGLVEYAALGKDDTVAIIGATGGVGGAAVQIAKRIGAHVIAINRSHPAADSRLARLADDLLDSSSSDLASALRSFNEGRGADVVFNAAGGPMFEVGLGLLAHRGRQVEITSPTERRVNFDLVDFYHNESQLFGVDTLKRGLTSSARILEKLRDGFEDGSYQPPSIAEMMPLSGAQQAYELVGQGMRGRVVLRPSL
jgi:NADPH:quinone reductase-like Zn-dependent oxidoreductase